MALPTNPICAPFVIETANAPGTGTITLLGSSSDRKTFASAFNSGQSVYYWLDDQNQAEWGLGTFTLGSGGNPNTLSRDTVIGNTAGTTAKLNFTGSTSIYSDVPGNRLLTLNEDGTIRNSQTQASDYQTSIGITFSQSYAQLASFSFTAQSPFVMAQSQMGIYNSGNGSSGMNVQLRLFDVQNSGEFKTVGVTTILLAGSYQVVPLGITFGALTVGHTYQVRAYGQNYSGNSSICETWACQILSPA